MNPFDFTAEFFDDVEDVVTFGAIVAADMAYFWREDV